MAVSQVKACDALDNKAVSPAIYKIAYQSCHTLTPDRHLSAAANIEKCTNKLGFGKRVENLAAAPVGLVDEVPAALTGHAEATGELPDLVDSVGGNEDGAQHVATADGLVDEGVEGHAGRS